ncbi:uncharacterized protein LOC127102204 [Lathyrus oleraceus]|uniref:uncharacterized protein LOC127102204 n=1 Tax=Pisum sativum TaxID=3888 RepID=UPI0021D3082E|nr:uncharacterized protein LOC127102204 [Pisum sativum]
MEPPNRRLPFKIMRDASDYAVGAVLGQRKDKKLHAIFYASRTLDPTQMNYATTEKELLAVVFALDKFRSYLVGAKIINYTDHAAIRYLLNEHPIDPPSPPETPPIYEYLNDPIHVDESDPETPPNYYNIDEPELLSYVDNLAMLLTRLDDFHVDITTVKEEIKIMRLDILGLMDVVVEQFDHLNQAEPALG